MIIGLMYVDESPTVSTLKFSAVAEGVVSLGVQLRAEGFEYDEDSGFWHFNGGMVCRLETYVVGWAQ